jgi:hypothetical protein
VAETLASHCWRKVCIIGREAHLACTIPEGDYTDMDGVGTESHTLMVESHKPGVVGCSRKAMVV